MIIDPVCSLVFEAERAESDVMRRAPRPMSQPLFTSGMLIWAVVQGGFALSLVITTYIIALKNGMDENTARALTFVTLVAANIGLTLINRSFHRRSFFALILRDNRVLWIVFAAVSVTLTAVLTWSPLRSLFRFGPLSADDVLLAAATGIVVLAALNIAKLWAPLARGAAR